MKKTIGILAHVDSGKTTFCEQVLYHTNVIRKIGRVDNKDTFLDSHEIEKQRGITIFSEQAMFSYNNSEYYLIDTPGHIDFSPDMERSISIMDYAVIIVSSIERVQSHTKTVFRLLKNYNVPTIFFINKIDREGSNLENVINDIKNSLTNDVINISDNLNLNLDMKLSEELIEFIAERNDILFEHYLDENYNEKLWLDSMKEMIKENRLYPLMYGSALQDINIDEFIKKLDYLTYTNYNKEDEFIGEVYKIKYDENKNRITYIKALQGSLRVKDEVNYSQGNNIKEKINEIRINNSDKYISTNEVYAGDVFSVCGLSKTKIGNLILSNNTNEGNIKTIKSQKKLEIIPTLKSKVIFDHKLNVRDILSYFNILNDEEPALNVKWDEYLKEIHIHVMGKIQLEILKSIMKDRFNVDIEFGKCEILYKETIACETFGYGHFEPLGHYAEVHLKIAPSNRNKGIDFNSIAHVDNLSIGHQNLVKTHIFEKSHNGILGGYPLTDVDITLLTGRAHNKHTSGGDFREATFRALRQGLENTKNILLEPYYKFSIEIGTDYVGRVMSDIQKKSGSFETPIIKESISIINGRGPVATFMDYPMEIISFSKSTGSINYIFDGYDVCHNSEEVLENRGYDKDSDAEYTSNSIFFSKGQAYVVKGNEAKNSMHCLGK